MGARKISNSKSDLQGHSECFHESPEAMLRFGRIMETLYKAKNVVHAFGYNSAEGEPIWVKSEALRAHWWGLTTADFGRDQRISDSLRGSRNFVFLVR